MIEDGDNCELYKRKKGLDVIKFLPDEIWFRIYSYLHLHRHEPLFNCTRRGDNNSSLDVATLASQISLVSKEESKRMSRYLVQVPQHFTHNYYDLATYAWACRNGMKLGGVISFTSIGRIALNLFIHMIKSCNINDLHTLTLNLQHQSSKNTSRHYVTSAIKVGIPFHVLEIPMSPIDFQRQFTDHLTDYQYTSSLKKMHLRIQKDELYTPFLTNFSPSLEELSLHIINNEDEKANFTKNKHDLETISVAIESMSKLKKLTICADFQAVIRIRSTSLEEINIMPTRYDFRLDECTCPSLRLFKSHRCNWSEDILDMNSTSRAPLEGIHCNREHFALRPRIYGRIVT